MTKVESAVLAVIVRQPPIKSSARTKPLLFFAFIFSQLLLSVAMTQKVGNPPIGKKKIAYLCGVHVNEQLRYNSATSTEGPYYRIKVSYHDVRGNVYSLILLTYYFICSGSRARASRSCGSALTSSTFPLRSMSLQVGKLRTWRKYRAGVPDGCHGQWFERYCQIQRVFRHRVRLAQLDDGSILHLVFLAVGFQRCSYSHFS